MRWPDSMATVIASRKRRALTAPSPPRCRPAPPLPRRMAKRSTITAQLLVDGEHRTVTGKGNGPIAAFVHAVQSDLGIELEVVDYAEHAVTAGADASAVAYVEARGEDGITWGVGMDESISSASLKAVISAVNRLRA